MANGGITVGIRIKDMDWFNEFKDTVIKMLDDNRIPKSIRKEYHEQIMAVLDKYQEEPKVDNAVITYGKQIS